MYKLIAIIFLLPFLLLSCQQEDGEKKPETPKNDSVQEAPGGPKTAVEQNDENSKKLDEIMSIETPNINTKNDSLYQEIMSTGH